MIVSSRGENFGAGTCDIGLSFCLGPRAGTFGSRVETLEHVCMKLWYHFSV